MIHFILGISNKINQNIVLQKLEPGREKTCPWGFGSNSEPAAQPQKMPGKSGLGNRLYHP